MAKLKSSSGLYFWAKDFWREQNVGIYLSQKKDEITTRYIEKMAPQLFAARASAAFGGADISAIDNFFKGVDGNQGYINRLQQELNKYYTASLRNANNIFVSHTGLNAILASKKGNITRQDLTSEQLQELDSMMKAQQIIIDKLSLLASDYEAYVLERAASSGYKPPRPLKNGSGLYHLGNYKDKGMKQAIKIYNDIRAALNELQATQVTDDLTHSFSAFRKTADKFHQTYAEYLTQFCASRINKAEQATFKGTPLDAKWTGNTKYIPGQGDISVDVKSFLDPEFQEMINTPYDFSLKKITATNDVTITSAEDSLIGTYGVTVKEYSDITLTKTGKFTTISSSMGNIYQAANFAMQRGLPSSMASSSWINNLGGALVTEGEVGTAQRYWKEYKQLLGSLLSLDALMGKMIGNNVSSNANNLVYYENGQVFYMGDIVKQYLNNIRGFSGSMFTQENSYAQDNARKNAEQAHWDNVLAKGSAKSAEEAIEAVLSSVLIKVSINLSSLLKGLT